MASLLCASSTARGADLAASAARAAFTLDPTAVLLDDAEPQEAGEATERSATQETVSPAAPSGWRRADIEHERARTFGEAGQTRWTVAGLFGSDLEGGDSRDGIAVYGVGLTHFIDDGLALAVELNGVTVQQDEGKDTNGVNANLLFRWHFHRRRTWSAFLDGGVGVMYTDRKVPDDGSNLNLTPQAGGGLSFEIGPDIRLLAGLRWHHISNANTFSDNPGRDHLAGWLGVSVGF